LRLLDPGTAPIIDRSPENQPIKPEHLHHQANGQPKTRASSRNHAVLRSVHLLVEVAGETVAAENAKATTKVQRGIVRDCLTGATEG
jgi:hypothetical protein